VSEDSKNDMAVQLNSATITDYLYTPIIAEYMPAKAVMSE
jgi:hypothetical protein